MGIGWRNWICWIRLMEGKGGPMMGQGVAHGGQGCPREGRGGQQGGKNVSKSIRVNP